MKYMLKTRGEIEKIELRHKVAHRIGFWRDMEETLSRKVFDESYIKPIGKLKTRTVVEVLDWWIPKAWLSEVTIEDERDISEASERSGE